MKSPLPAIEVLRRFFDYDSVTGLLTWRARAANDRHGRMRARRYEGRAAGSLRADGYVIVSPVIDGVTHRILAHRLAWALHHGKWPAAELDHIDGDHANNRLANLREAIRVEQMQNMVARPLMGVSADARGSIIRYYAVIRARGERVHLGSFDTPEAAHAAYLEAKARLHSFQPVPRR